MKTVADESDFPLEELARQLLYLNGSFSADSSALPPPEQLKSPKLEIESPHSSPLRTVYCQCYATGTYCNGCSCFNCQNNIENETARHSAAAYILEHYPKVFGPKIETSPNKAVGRGKMFSEYGEVRKRLSLQDQSASRGIASAIVLISSVQKSAKALTARTVKTAKRGILAADPLLNPRRGRLQLTCLVQIGGFHLIAAFNITSSHRFVHQH